MGVGQREREREKRPAWIPPALQCKGRETGRGNRRRVLGKGVTRMMMMMRDLSFAV
jgi:hypothetical protein